tara:strand:- start:1516 stop:1821 length:306 start_codon:yes stop_codon:yes gene_type:complete
MAGISNASVAVGDLAEQVSSILMEKAGFLISIFKAVGIVVLIYVIYLIIRGAMRWKDRRRWKRIERKIDVVNVKLERLLGQKGGKEEKKEKKERKKKKRKS